MDYGMRNDSEIEIREKTRGGDVGENVCLKFKAKL